MSVKLPVSTEMALTLPWVTPTRYGLGKSGWATATLESGSGIDLETMKGWIGQRYRAAAPKTLVKTLDRKQTGLNSPLRQQPRRQMLFETDIGRTQA